MSKYDPLIHDFLVRNKKIALEKIGEFVVSSESVSLDNNGDSISTPQIEFHYNRRVETSPEFIEFLASHFSKSAMLVASDFSSNLEQDRQYINIGKSYVIPYVGIISMSKTGEYEFSQQAAAFKPEDKHANRQQHTHESPLEDRAKSKKGITAVAVIIIALIVAGIGWGAYSYFSGKNKTTAEEDTTAASQVTDTAPHIADSSRSVKPADSAAQPLIANTKDSMTCRFVFEVTQNGERARNRTAQLRSFGDPAHYDSTIHGGDTTYKLFFRSRVAIADTAKIRDSLALYFERKVTIQ